MRISDWSSDLCSSDLPFASRHRHVEDMGQPAAGAQACLPPQQRRHEGVGVDMSLHKGLRLAGTGERRGAGGGGILACRMNNLGFAEVPADLVGNAADFFGIADQEDRKSVV